MSKATVTKLFIGGAIAVVAGAILAFAAIWLAIANDVFVLAGSDIVGIQGSALSWPLLAAGILGGLAVVGGSLASFVAWIGALLNTWQLESKTWFAVLLVLGVFSFGFVAMFAYLIAGPDGTTSAKPNQAPAPAGA